MRRVISPRLTQLLPAAALAIATAGVFTVFDTVAAEDTAGDAVRGATSWAQNCARCHDMRSPTEFRDDLWRPIVTHMRVRAGLTGQQQRDILAFLQEANNPAPVPVPGGQAAQPMTGAVLSGKEIYDQTCIACHGPRGTGAMPGVPDFTAAVSPLGKPDGVLMKHIMEGFQSPGASMAMPPLGGNPDLNEADVRAVLGYLRASFGK